MNKNFSIEITGSGETFRDCLQDAWRQIQSLETPIIKDDQGSLWELDGETITPYWG